MHIPITIQIVSYLGSILIPLAFLPQTIKTIRTKNTKGLSLTCYCIFLIGVIAFLIFGIISNNIQLIVCEILTLILTLLIMFVIISNLFKYHSKEAKQ